MAAAVPARQQRIGDSGLSEQQAATGATLTPLQPPGLNGCIVLGVTSACMQQRGGGVGGRGGGGDLRDGVLCEGQILHQHVQAFVVFIQELSHPPGDTRKKKEAGLATPGHAGQTGNVLGGGGV